MRVRKINIQVRTVLGWRTHHVTETFDRCKDAKAHFLQLCAAGNLAIPPQDVRCRFTRTQ
jgi:hypothetical protein